MAAEADVATDHERRSLISELFRGWQETGGVSEREETVAEFIAAQLKVRALPPLTPAEATLLETLISA
jgi:hypothetical protein